MDAYNFGKRDRYFYEGRAIADQYSLLEVEKMADNIVPFNKSETESPFDGIRQIDESGNEFWSARSLMDLLGYVKWQQFSGVIGVAKENLEVAQGDVSSHFLLLGVTRANRQILDFRLSRLACYHVALACDSRGKPTVKLAKHYFAVKTREAETIVPAQSDRLRELEAENENMRLKIKVYELQTQAIAAATSLAIVAPAIAEAIICPGVTIVEKVEHVDRTIVLDGTGKVLSESDGIGITAIQRQFGFKSTKAAWAWLESIGYGKDSGYWNSELTAHATAKLPRSAMADLRSKFAGLKGDRQKLIGEF